MPKPGKLKWEGDRLVLEIDATIRVPIEIEAITKSILNDTYLTTREKQALDGLLKGLQNKEIADGMSLSTRTVKFYVSGLLKKFNVTNRTELMAIFGTKRARPE